MSTSTQYREFRPIWPQIPIKDQGWRSLVNGREIVVEIGCGVGLHPIQYATANPDKFVIGIEKTTNKYKKFAGRLAKHPQLDNVLAIHANAIEWITKYISTSEVTAYFLLYPNPYPKESQRNKRLMHMPFMQYLIKTMLPGATLTIATNMAFFYAEAKETIEELSIVQDKTISGTGRTHFERKYLADNQTCYEIVLAKKQDKIMNEQAEQILDFWFSNQAKWFAKDTQFDNLIREKFIALYIQAEERQLNSWTNNPKEMLALIILTDQFSRNMFRDSADMYRSDDYARSLTHEALSKNYLEKLDNKQQINFILMPLMHSEILDDQKLAVQLFRKYGSTESANYAEKHKVIIEKFGRFPHRNKLLNRPSTSEELEFLKGPNSGF